MQEKLISWPMSTNSVNKKLDVWRNLIREATIEASEVYDDAVTDEDWKEGLLELKEQLEYTRNY